MRIVDIWEMEDFKDLLPRGIVDMGYGTVFSSPYHKGAAATFSSVNVQISAADAVYHKLSFTSQFLLFRLYSLIATILECDLLARTSLTICGAWSYEQKERHWLATYLHFRLIL